MDINQATKQELLLYAREELGLDLQQTLRVDDIRRAVAEARGEEYTPAVPKPKKDEKLYTIHIAKNGGPMGDNDVQVGVNGKAYLLKRGVDIPNVPESVIGVLRTAVEKRYEQRVDPATRREYTAEREVPSYPFSVVA